MDSENEVVSPEVEVVVDQEILDENPALAEAGVELGSVGVEATEEEAAAFNAEVVAETPAEAVAEEVNGADGLAGAVEAAA